jgi:hypothetical protein
MAAARAFAARHLEDIMEERQPSRTALGAAGYRAAHRFSTGAKFSPTPSLIVS